MKHGGKARAPREGKSAGRRTATPPALSRTMSTAPGRPRHRAESVRKLAPWRALLKSSDQRCVQRKGRDGASAHSQGAWRTSDSASTPRGSTTGTGLARRPRAGAPREPRPRTVATRARPADEHQRSSAWRRTVGRSCAMRNGSAGHRGLLGRVAGRQDWIGVPQKGARRGALAAARLDGDDALALRPARGTRLLLDPAAPP